jgi:leucyl-tRNA synthetase
VWNLNEKATDGADYSKENEAAIHKAIKKVSSDIENMKFNTAIATLMALVNDFYAKGLSKGDYKALLLMLSPFAPHMCEELWEMNGGEKMIGQEAWPTYDESKTLAAEVQLAVQVMGKVKANVVIAAASSDEEIVAAAMANEKIARLAEGKTLAKHIVVRDKQKQPKLVNLILK